MRLLIIAILFSSICQGQTPMRWLTKRASSSYSYLLDSYSGAAAAYSLRKLSSSYSGSAIRVRRSSDNTEQDIGFTGSCNTLDTASLKTFVGAGSGYVVTWYDQSGNTNNIIQATGLNQPRIVNSGVVERNGLFPSVTFISPNSYLSRANFLSGVSAATVYFVAKDNNDPPSGSAVGAVVDNTGSPSSTHMPYSDGNIYDGWATSSRKSTGNPSTSLTSPYLYNAVSAASDWRSYINNTLFYSTATNTVSVTTSFYVGKSSASTDVFDGKIFEIVVYNSASSTGDRSGIAGNINSFYTIF